MGGSPNVINRFIDALKQGFDQNPNTRTLGKNQNGRSHTARLSIDWSRYVEFANWGELATISSTLDEIKHEINYDDANIERYKSTDRAFASIR